MFKSIIEKVPELQRLEQTVAALELEHGEATDPASSRPTCGAWLGEGA